jgi:hypothetical protein
MSMRRWRKCRHRHGGSHGGADLNSLSMVTAKIVTHARAWVTGPLQRGRQAERPGVLPRTGRMYRTDLARSLAQGRGGTASAGRRWSREVDSGTKRKAPALCAGLFLIADYRARGRWQAVSAIPGLFHLFAPYVNPAGQGQCLVFSGSSRVRARCAGEDRLH